MVYCGIKQSNNVESLRNKIFGVGEENTEVRTAKTSESLVSLNLNWNYLYEVMIFLAYQKARDSEQDNSPGHPLGLNYCLWTYFPNKRKQDFLEKLLILGLGKEIHKINHLVILKSKIATSNHWGPVKGLGNQWNCLPLGKVGTA